MHLTTYPTESQGWKPNFHLELREKERNYSRIPVSFQMSQQGELQGAVIAYCGEVLKPFQGTGSEVTQVPPQELSTGVERTVGERVAVANAVLKQCQKVLKVHRFRMTCLQDQCLLKA
jgi:hypothetical protein